MSPEHSGPVDREANGIPGWQEEAAAVVVRVAGAEFGLPIDRVREVVRVPPITRLPFPPPSIRGVASIRGSIVPVMDLGLRLLGTRARDDGRLVVVRDAATESDVALLVDAVLGLTARGERALTPPPEVEAALPEGWVAEVIASEPDRLVTMLHLDPVLALTDSAEEER